MVRKALLAAGLTMAVAAPSSAQTAAEPPSHYALTGGRIVVSPGRVIEQGTVHIRDGRIVAVGPQVDVPATAVRIDIAGQTIYPGLIDVASTTGLPRIAAPQGGRPGGGQQGGQAGDEAPAQPPELRADRLAADVFRPSASALAALRANGITTVGLAFDGGILPGQTAAAATGSGEPDELLLRAPVSQQIALGRRRGGYPGTLMATVAYIRQAFHDARHGAAVRDAFERSPTSAPRPGYDAQSRALAPVAAGNLPAWLFASTQRDLERVVDLARAVEIRDYAIVGAQEGWLATDLLRSAGVPVVVSLDFPEPDDVTGRSFELHAAPPTGEDTVGARADSTVARAARANAATLQAAGIPIALAGYGLDGPAAFREAILAAVEAGLGADDALRALTVTPARLLGLDNALGTLEPGRMANLLVVDGDLFSEQGRIRQVFVEGERFEIRAAERRAARRGGDENDRAVAGEYTGSIEGPEGTMPFTLTLREEDAISGQISTEMGVTALRGEWQGDDLVLRGTFSPPGMNALEITITARPDDGALRGTLLVQGMAEMPFNATRRGPGASWQGGGAV